MTLLGQSFGQVFRGFCLACTCILFKEQMSIASIAIISAVLLWVWNWKQLEVIQSDIWWCGLKPIPIMKSSSIKQRSPLCSKSGSSLTAIRKDSETQQFGPIENHPACWSCRSTSKIQALCSHQSHVAPVQQVSVCVYLLVPCCTEHFACSNFESP